MLQHRSHHRPVVTAAHGLQPPHADVKRERAVAEKGSGVEKIPDIKLRLERIVEIGELEKAMDPVTGRYARQRDENVGEREGDEMNVTLTDGAESLAVDEVGENGEETDCQCEGRQ